MSDLSKGQKRTILEFIQRYLVQLVNASFAALDFPREVVGFIYERTYFAYASEKNQVTGSVRKIEEMYKGQNIQENNMKMVLKITRPLVKINYLVNGDLNVISMIKFQEPVDLNEKNNVQRVINFSDKVLSKFIKEMFDNKNKLSNNKDENANFISSAIEKLNELAESDNPFD